MSIWAIWTILWGTTAVVAAIVATIQFVKMLDELNDRLPPSERFVPPIASPGFYATVMAAHHKRFPSSGRSSLVRRCKFLVFVASLIAVLPWWVAELRATNGV